MLFAQDTTSLIPAELYEPSMWPVLGMGAFVIALAGLGYQLTAAWRDPSPATIGTALLVVSIPLLIAWSINRVLRRSELQS